MISILNVSKTYEIPIIKIKNEIKLKEEFDKKNIEYLFHNGYNIDIQGHCKINNRVLNFLTKEPLFTLSCT